MGVDRLEWVSTWPRSTCMKVTSQRSSPSSRRSGSAPTNKIRPWRPWRLGGSTRSTRDRSRDFEVHRWFHPEGLPQKSKEVEERPELALGDDERRVDAFDSRVKHAHAVVLVCRAERESNRLSGAGFALETDTESRLREALFGSSWPRVERRVGAQHAERVEHALNQGRWRARAERAERARRSSRRGARVRRRTRARGARCSRVRPGSRYGRRTGAPFLSALSRSSTKTAGSSSKRA